MSQNKNNKNLNTATPISFDYESRRGAEDNSRLNKIISGSKKATVYALLAVLAANFLFGPTAVNANLLDDLNKLNKEAEAKKKEIENLKNEINVYTKNIQSKQQESITLQNQIQIFNDKIAKIELDIQALVLEVEALEIEIQEIKLQIEQASEKIDKQKTLLTEYIRRINKNDQTTYLEILVLNNSFYEFFDEVKNLTDVQDDLKDSIVVIKQLKEQLDRQQVALEEKLRKVEELKQRQENEIRNLAENKDAKKRLLAETLSQEQKFQQLLEQARTERLAANAAVVKIENDVRQKLEALDDLDSGALPGQLLLSWPVAPNRGISTYFRDPTYPFRYLFEHTAIDIPSPQGTPIRAPAPGYVARAYDAGFGYSYIMLVHRDGFSTVYGHVSAIDVLEDTYVTRGQIIGRVGGMPGTRGAGRLTTGPHLHLEVRLKGIPVDPLNYLP